MSTTHPTPFPYEDTLESSIRNLIAHNDKYDPTGALNAARIPPRRLRQSLTRPKWYSPDLHATSPYLSAFIAPSHPPPPPPPSSPPTLTPNNPHLPLTVTLHHHHHHHHPSPSSNPDNRPITFNLHDTRLTSIGRTQPYPWLLLYHTPTALEGGLKEIESEEDDDVPSGAHPSEALLATTNNTSSSVQQEEQQTPKVSAENGFISLAVGESTTFEVDFAPAPGLLVEGGRYEICFRGVAVGWWEFGSVEELEGKGVRKDGRREKGGEVLVPCSNLVGFVVGRGKGEGEKVGA